MATNAAAQNAIKKKLVQRLEVRLGSKPGAREWVLWEEHHQEGHAKRDSISISSWIAWPGWAGNWAGDLLGLVLTTLSSQHAAKQAAASATQTIAAAQHAASTPKASAGPQPLLVQSCKVRLSGRRCGRRETFPQSVGR